MRSRLAKLERRPRRCICDPISGVQYAKCFERWTLVLSSKTSPDLRMARRWPLFGEWPASSLGGWALGICVVTCVVTLPSLPMSREFARCCSGTGEGH